MVQLHARAKPEQGVASNTGNELGQNQIITYISKNLSCGDTIKLIGIELEVLHTILFHCLNAIKTRCIASSNEFCNCSFAFVMKECSFSTANSGNIRIYSFLSLFKFKK